MPMSTPFQSQFQSQFRVCKNAKHRTQVDSTPLEAQVRKRPFESTVNRIDRDSRSFSDFGRERGTFSGTSVIPETIVLSDTEGDCQLVKPRQRRHRFNGNEKRLVKKPKPSTSSATTIALRRELSTPVGASQDTRQFDAGNDESDATDNDNSSHSEPRRFSAFGPLMESIPKHNTFLEGIAGGEPENEDQVEGVEDIVARDAPPLVTARESGFFDTSVETGHEDMAVRVAAGAVYFRWHQIDENDVRILLVADRIATRSPLYQVIRVSCVRHQSHYQNRAMKWFKSGVVATCIAMGGQERLEQATSVERQQIWRTMFEKDPLKMAKACMPSAQRSVDLHGIFNSADPRGAKWRRYIKTCFIWMAEDTFNYRVIRDDDETAFSNWRSMPRRRQIFSLGLGDTFDVPVRHGGMYDTDRRLVGRAYMNNPTYVLEDE